MGESTGAPTALPRQRGDDLAWLVAAVRVGNRAAWDSLVDRHAGLVWSICRQYGLARPDTEDVFQTVWLTLLEHLDSLRDTKALPGWLATTTRRLCLLVLKRDRRVRPENNLLVDIAEPSTAVDVEVVERDHVAQVLRDLDELPTRQRAILALLYDGFRIDEIAEQLGLSSSTVRTHIHRARQSMRSRAGWEPAPSSIRVPRQRRPDHDDLDFHQTARTRRSA